MQRTSVPPQQYPARHSRAPMLQSSIYCHLHASRGSTSVLCVMNSCCMATDETHGATVTCHQRLFSNFNCAHAGTFTCAGCGTKLFASETKFDSGTGWPSFYKALPNAVDEVPDNSIPFMSRVEVRCHNCQGHIGHVFKDGPKPTNLRYCMNGLAMNFQPA